MEFFNTLRNYSRNHWALLMGNLLYGFITWQFHFVLQFYIIFSRALPNILVLFHFIGLAAGAAISVIVRIWIKGAKIWLFQFTSLTLSTLLVTFLLVSNILSLIPIAFVIIGIANGFLYGIFNLQMEIGRSKPEYAGKLYSIGWIGVSILVIIESLIIQIYPIIMAVLFILGTGSVTAILLFFGRNVSNLFQKKLDVSKYLKNKKDLPALLFAFLYGFFFTNSYYSAILMVEFYDIMIDFNSFIISLLLVVGIFSIVSGILADVIGRRITILLGMNIQALAFLVFTFILQSDVNFIFLFPIILGIGFAFTLAPGMLLLAEISKLSLKRDTGAIFFVLAALGMIFGTLIGEIHIEIIKFVPVNLALIQLYIIISATLVVFKLRETLPPKQELEWKRAIQYLYVIKKGGIVIYSQDLSQLGQPIPPSDEDLLVGAVSAISSILNEIAHNRNPLKVIEQEGFTILLEESQNIFVLVITIEELKIIRKKMKNFTTEFQEFFEDVLKMEIVDLRLYLPTKKLVEKHFQ